MIKLLRNEDDLFLYEREIRLFLPARIFDAHCHLVKTEYHNEENASDDLFFYNVEMDDLQHCWQTFFPDSQVNGLVMGMPVYHCDLEAENEFVVQSIADAGDRFY